jgi:bifunctional non-homologous end joining protein LigD
MFRETSRPRFIEPQLASSVNRPPEGKHWIHEVKHDGYRS